MAFRRSLKKLRAFYSSSLHHKFLVTATYSFHVDAMHPRQVFLHCALEHWEYSMRSFLSTSKQKKKTQSHAVSQTHACAHTHVDTQMNGMVGE